MVKMFKQTCVTSFIVVEGSTFLDNVMQIQTNKCMLKAQRHKMLESYSHFFRKRCSCVDSEVYSFEKSMDGSKLMLS